MRDGQRARLRRGRHIERLAEVSLSESPPEQESGGGDDRTVGGRGAVCPNGQRDAVLLIYAEERSHAEAGEILGCAEATVSWHIHEARKTLRGLL